MSKNIGVFVAWPYANGDLHLGHVAGAYLPADIFARFHRLKGNKVLMVSGSDAHGTPITLKAREESSTPFDVVMRYHERFLEGWQRLGITFDLFTHTHTENHKNIVQSVFKTLHDNSDLEVQTQKQFYDEEASMFLPDRYVTGTCPFCGFDKARGDQCDNCGKTFETTELKDPVSKITQSKPVLKDTDHFHFLMGKYQDKLKTYVDKQKHWRPTVLNYTQSMIEEGLKSRPITRDIDWGIQVPIEGWESKVLYVWFDAVVGYYSGSVEWSDAIGRGDHKDWWENSDAQSYYFIGKDNVPFHSVIWPIELMAFNEKLNLPYDVPANQFLNIDGEKFSTSRGLAVWLLDVLDAIGVDSVRYYLTCIMPETKDANFYWEEMQSRNNGEMVAAWGNLVNRVLGFAYGRYDAKVPAPKELKEIDQELISSIEKGFESIGSLYESVRLRDALKDAMALVRSVNRYLDEKAPWTEYKSDPEAAGTTIFVAMKAIDSLKTILAPVLPHSCQQIHEWFGYSEPLFGVQKVIERVESEGTAYNGLTYEPTVAEQNCTNLWQPSELEPGKSFAKPTPLFKVLEEKDFLS